LPLCRGFQETWISPFQQFLDRRAALTVQHAPQRFKTVIGKLGPQSVEPIGLAE